MKPFLRLGLIALCLAVTLGCSQTAKETSATTDAAAKVDTDIFAGAPPLPKGAADMGAFKAGKEKGEFANIEGPFTVPDEVAVHKDLEYANINGQSLKLDLCAPKELSKPAPVILFVHGGGWSGGRKEEYEFYLYDFAKKGYIAASMTYRFTDVAKYPAQVQDCKAAIRWLRAHAAEYNIDPNRIAIMGGSAGGYLALMVGYSNDPALEGDGGNADQSSRVQAVIDGYGPTDFTEPFARQAPQITGLLGATFEQNPELFRKASPLFNITKETPPTLIIHGTIDKTVPIGHSEVLDAELTKAGVPHAFIRVEGFPHTADSFAGVFEHCSYVIDRFLKLYMK